MSSHRLAPRYAKSLLELGLEHASLERIYNDITQIREAFKNRDFYLLLKSPIIKGDQKIKVFDAIFGGVLSRETELFVKLIIKKGREEFLSEITAAFIDQYKKHKHISPVLLKTASPLTDEQIRAIHDKLKSSKETDDHIELTTEVNAALIGGFVIEIGDKQYDASVAHQLDQIKKSFQDNKYIKS